MTKLIFTIALIATSYSSVAQQHSIASIEWPAIYEPSKSKFYIENEIEINASPDEVWLILIDALEWESWYKGAKNVSFKNPADSILAANSVFKWKTMGLKFESTIQQFKPNRLLAWESKKQHIQGFHVWLIIPTETGSRVITAESQNGWLTFFEKIFQPNKLKKLHDTWLAELKSKSENQ